MTSSLSDLLSNLAERIHEIKFGYRYDDKKCKTYGIKYKYYECYLEYNVIDGLIQQKCFCCNKNYSKKLDENSKKRFPNIYKFTNHDINKCILLLRKGVYPYQCMDDWKKFSETSLPEGEDF